MSSSPLCFFLLFLAVRSADGYLEFMVDRCVFNSTELKDMEFIRSFYFNKVEDVRFSSSVGRFVGYTEPGLIYAKNFNKDPGQIAAMKALKETYCLNNVNNEYRTALSKSWKPYVVLSSTALSGGGGQNGMLICGVYSFYPKTIKVTWLRDGQEVTSDVTTTEELPDGDWYYQVHSTLEYTPRSGEKISCMVEHASLKEPLITHWNPSMSESERNQLAIGASGLILGLVLSLAGFIYYKRKARGRILVPTN